MRSVLTGSTVLRETLDAPQRQQMLALMQRCYAGVDAQRFERDLDQKQYVILLRARHTGELAGFSTLQVAQEFLGTQQTEIVFTGDTVIDPDYWGNKELQRQFSRFLLNRKLKRLFKPVHWLLLSAGYKTYLLAVNYFPRTHPRHNWTAPEDLRSSLDALVLRWFGEQYRPSMGTLRFANEHYRVREGLSPIDRESGAHPDIAFFAQKNPGHIVGEELVCLSEVRLWDLSRAVLRITKNHLFVRLRRGLRVFGVGARA